MYSRLTTRGSLFTPLWANIHISLTRITCFISTPACPNALLQIPMMLAKAKAKLKLRSSSSTGDSVAAGSSKSRPPSDPSKNHTSGFADGIRVLHDSTDAVLDVCFIHGLTGNRDSTWTAKGQEQPWPAVLLASILRARLLAFGYNAYFVRKRAGPSVNQLLDHAQNLLFDLSNDRKSCKAVARPLIFVAHSLGGLVCKQTVLLSQNHPANHQRRDIFDSLKGIIFMGTPHRGTWIADWAAIPASALGIFRSTNKPLLDVLGTDNQFLASIHAQFLSMLRGQHEQGRSIEITCFFEELPIFRSMIVVPKESAILENYDHYSIHANHAGMVKFASSEDTGFKRVAAELTGWQESIIDSIEKTQQERQWPAGQHHTHRVRNITAGDKSTQVFNLDSMDAEGVTAGDEAIQYFGQGAEALVGNVRRPLKQRSSDKNVVEEEELMISATSSTAR